MSTKRNLTRLAFCCVASLPLFLSPVYAQAEPLTTTDTSHEVVVAPDFVTPGPHTQYPSDGGTWEYGFWSAKFRSYYTVNKCHGSTVRDGDRESRSIDTKANSRSIAELWGLNNPNANPQYFYRVC